MLTSKIQTRRPAARPRGGERRRRVGKHLGRGRSGGPAPVLILRVSRARPEPEVLARAAAVLRGGGLVALPTETVYGLGAHALDEAAVGRIFAAKGRPAYNPLIVHVADTAAARGLALRWDNPAERLAARFWPGPLTLVVPKRATVPDLVTAGLASVALRVPAHPVAHALLRAAGLPVAAPSANRFTRLSPTTAQHVADGLGDRVDLILDAGPTPVGIESTVLDLTGARPALLRPGSITREQIEAVVGPVDAAGDEPRGEAPRPAPGMLDRHYAPRAVLRLFTDPEQARAAAHEAAAAGVRVGALVRERLGVEAEEIVMPGDPAGYAAALYAALHRLDALGCGLALVEAPPAGPGWAGVADRLRRAAT